MFFIAAFTSVRKNELWHKIHLTFGVEYYFRQKIHCMFCMSAACLHLKIENSMI